eukprot:scaffold234528_cov26-Tisochrysis_lutea.AAC.1
MVLLVVVQRWWCKGDGTAGGDAKCSRVAGGDAEVMVMEGDRAAGGDAEVMVMKGWQSCWRGCKGGGGGVATHGNASHEVGDANWVSTVKLPAPHFSSSCEPRAFVCTPQTVS